MIKPVSKGGDELLSNGRRARPGLWVSGAILAAAIASAGAIAFWSRPEIMTGTAARGITEENPDADFPEPVVDNPGYVGVQACAACHAERVAEFQTTNHFRTFRVPEAKAMPAGFAAGRGEFQSHHRSLRFEMTRDGDDFFQAAIHTVPAGDQRTKSRIDLVLGAGGKADEVYLTWRENRLFELPVAWLFTSDEWGSSHISPHASGAFFRESTLRCLECHNTWFAHVPGSLNEYKPDSFLMGVSCENCHGPAREHVALYQSKRHESHRNESPGPESHPEALLGQEIGAGQAIVRPASLSRERQIEVCTQCHSNAIQHLGPAFSYRPGEPLNKYYKTLVAPRHIEDDHVANQVKYLRQSKCFQNSDELTCTTCHDPHRPVNPAATGIDSCRKCHNDADCREQPRLPAAVTTNCIGCHMPADIKINVNFETEDDEYVPPIRRCNHRIAILPRARDKVMLAWHQAQTDPHSREEADRLTRSLVDGWLTEADACRRDHRVLGAIAALREALGVRPSPEIREKLREAVALQVRIGRDLDDAGHYLAEHNAARAVDMLEAVLRIKPDHSKAHGKLGTAYATLGRNELAIEHWKSAAKYDPDDPYGYSMLAWQAFLEDRLEDSLEAYRRADEAEPHIAPINYRWGLALTKLCRWNDAADRFRYALSIDPYDAGSCQGLAHALRQQGQAAQALPFARRAARLTQFKNYDVLLTLTDVYADLQRFAEAADAAGQAHAAALVHAPEQASTILRRQEGLRQRARMSGNNPTGKISPY